MDNFEIPVELRKARFGVTEWHHPEIVELLDSSNPLNPLSDLLQAWMSGWPDADPAIGRARQTEESITSVELYRALSIMMNAAGLNGITSGPQNLARQLPKLATLPNWRGILTRRRVRTGNREQNRAQVQWHFQLPGTTPQPEGAVAQTPQLFAP